MQYAFILITALGFGMREVQSPPMLGIPSLLQIPNLLSFPVRQLASMLFQICSSNLSSKWGRRQQKPVGFSFSFIFLSVLSYSKERLAACFSHKNLTISSLTANPSVNCCKRMCTSSVKWYFLPSHWTCTDDVASRICYSKFIDKVSAVFSQCDRRSMERPIISSSILLATTLTIKYSDKTPLLWSLSNTGLQQWSLKTQTKKQASAFFFKAYSSDLGLLCFT